MSFGAIMLRIAKDIPLVKTRRVAQLWLCATCALVASLAMSSLASASTTGSVQGHVLDP